MLAVRGFNGTDDRADQAHKVHDGKNEESHNEETQNKRDGQVNRHRYVEVERLFPLLVDVIRVVALPEPHYERP